MSVIKGTTVTKTILDFSDSEQVSKSYIKQSLKNVEIRNHIHNDLGYYTFYNNLIKVGMYKIQLVLFTNLHETKSSLKDYKYFSVKIFENNNPINIEQDSRFSYKSIFGDTTNRPNLIEVIHHCKRLNDVRAFL